MLIILDQSEKKSRFTRETLLKARACCARRIIRHWPRSHPPFLLVLFPPFVLSSFSSSWPPPHPFPCYPAPHPAAHSRDEEGPVKPVGGASPKLPVCPRACREWAAAALFLFFICFSRLFLTKNRAINQGNCESASQSLGNNTVSTHNVARCRPSYSKDPLKMMMRHRLFPADSLQPLFRLRDTRASDAINCSIRVAPIVGCNHFAHEP